MNCGAPGSTHLWLIARLTSSEMLGWYRSNPKNAASPALCKGREQKSRPRVDGPGWSGLTECKHAEIGCHVLIGWGAGIYQ
jgi:hypothetical protein